jgi:filamentous hemagglutinin
LSGKKERFYEWDHTYNDIEIYNSKGTHLGSLDPVIAAKYKNAIPGRRSMANL